MTPGRNSEIAGCWRIQQDRCDLDCAMMKLFLNYRFTVLFGCLVAATLVAFFIDRRPGSNRLWIETKGGWGDDSTLTLDEHGRCEEILSSPSGEITFQSWSVPAENYHRLLALMDRGSLWSKTPDVLDGEMAAAEKISERWVNLVLTGTPDEDRGGILVNMRRLAFRQIICDGDRSYLHAHFNGREWRAEIIDPSPLFGGIRCRGLDDIAEVAGELKALRSK
ncbi:MAG: hypothetical protein JWO82_3994 [Akkermansiaceae bacterium]|nr:hypothetical protein [Akkermansiaceae bacterium]